MPTFCLFIHKASQKANIWHNWKIQVCQTTPNSVLEYGCVGKHPTSPNQWVDYIVDWSISSEPSGGGGAERLRGRDLIEDTDKSGLINPPVDLPCGGGLLIRSLHYTPNMSIPVVRAPGLRWSHRSFRSSSEREVHGRSEHAGFGAGQPGHPCPVVERNLV